MKSDTDQKLERDKLSSAEQKFSESETSLVPTLSSKTFVQKSGFVEKGDTMVFLSSGGNGIAFNFIRIER